MRAWELVYELSKGAADDEVVVVTSPTTAVHILGVHRSRDGNVKTIYLDPASLDDEQNTVPVHLF